MSCNLNFVLLIALLAAACLSNKAMGARPLGSDLRASWKLDEESSSCWESMMELQACSTEIIAFVFNGETQLGRSCCHAIRVIGEKCWPNLIDTFLQLTAEESDILEGFCVKESVNSTAPPLSSLHEKPMVVSEISPTP